MSNAGDSNLSESTGPTTGTPSTGSASTEKRRTPWVQLKYISYHPCIYPAMVGAASPDARAGDLVTVYDKTGQQFGAGLYNPKARVPLRVIYHGQNAIDEGYLEQRLGHALDLRQRLLRLPVPDETDAYRVVHSDGDGLSGLVVDRFASVLAVEVHSLGVFRRLERWLPRLHSALGTTHTVIRVDPRVASIEGIAMKAVPPPPVRSVRIRENGVRFEVDFTEGHKTGFFCDQRENRQRLACCAQGRRMLDLCCYSGGFAVAARVRGGASEATGVDLDERAIAQARRNANLNQTRVEWVHCDAFAYARQMLKNGRQWDLVVVDPPKFITSRDEFEEGRRKYEDLNRLALGLVQRHGLYVTCSCSGLLQAAVFEDTVVRAAHRMGRRLQVLCRTGAAADHPVMSNCPDGEYLKVLWAIVV